MDDDCICLTPEPDSSSIGFGITSTDPHCLNLQAARHHKLLIKHVTYTALSCMKLGTSKLLVKHVHCLKLQATGYYYTSFQYMKCILVLLIKHVMCIIIIAGH
jgi:hypothetical protein